MAQHGFLGMMLGLTGAFCAAATGADAQSLPSPPLQTCKDLRVSGKTGGVWESRHDAEHPGRFQVTIDLDCRATGIDVRNLEIHAQELSDTDPSVDRLSVGDAVDQVASIGPAATPTVFVTGRCLRGPAGCRFWLMLVDNGQDLARAPDLVAFLISDSTGKRLAYGAGPIGEGELRITGAE